MNVSNRKCIWHLGLRSLRANRTRNLVAVLAIALTAMLFTSLFTIAFSINDGIQQSSFRQVGGFAHGSFKYLTEEQYTELRTDPLIAEYGMRRVIGMPTDIPFNKSHVEIGYSDANEAHWMFCDPIEGRLPDENTNEAATDTRVLELLDITPELGAEFTVTFDVDGRTTTQTFTLCGWWEYDEAIVANHILIPESRVESILNETGITEAADGLTGLYNLDIMLKGGSRHIETDLAQILLNHGYQSDDRTADGFISTGVNWAYTGTQLSESLDPTMLLILAVLLLLILLTGYLIIYNVFQISVAGDIRLYGLMKTIGTTPRQLRRIIRVQALSLSVLGIPVGLLAGWFIGGVLTPVVTENLNGVTAIVSVNPLLFAGSALFALVTVFLSCRRPGRLAAKASPIEAVRYTEGQTALRKGKKRRRATKVSLLSMAWANLGRSRSKTAVTVLSLSLAIVLLTMTVTLGGSFDLDKYIAQFVSSDFLVGDANQFQTNGVYFSGETAVPQSVIEDIAAQGGITDGGRIYGTSAEVQEFVTEEWFCQNKGSWYTAEDLEQVLSLRERDEAGLLADSAQLYGMEPYALSRLTVIDGDLDLLDEPGYIAAVYSDDDHGNVEPGSHWAQLGDTVTLRYVERFEYYDPATGEVYPEGVDLDTVSAWQTRAAEYREVTYTVAARVVVPYAFTYRYFGSDEFILSAENFIADSGTDCVMYYAFDTANEATADMEQFLRDYTAADVPELDYESRASYGAQFETTRNMFLLLGGALSFVVGLVGILNFANAILTGIAARRRELAVLRSVGMTAKQLSIMLALEGLLYTLGAAALAFVLVLLTAPLLRSVLEGMFWFLTYRFTLLPVLTVLPVFAALGVVIPILSGRTDQKRSLVERLRQE